MITIELPWPHPALAPNRANGKHWAGLAAIKQKAKADAYVLAKAAGIGQGFDPVISRPLSILFIAPDKRRRDLDGCHGSIKHYLDGIAAALGIDDSQFRPVTLDYQKGEAPGKVIVSVGTFTAFGGLQA